MSSSPSDTVFEKAVGMGATSVFPPANTPWGTRWARVVDKWGNTWTFTTPTKPLMNQ